MANLEHVGNEEKHPKMSCDAPASCPPLPAARVPSVPDGPDGAAPCLIPSFAAASELLSAPYSCLVRNTHRRHIALAPLNLRRKKRGIQEELDTELLRFSQRLNGVPLAYDDVRIVGQHGSIHDDSGYIHMDIQATFIVFKPTKGQKLLGVVNKLGLGHVGCLVHSCFNASIPKPNLVPVETWRDAGPRIGAQLEFEVTALDADTAGVLLIRGRLSRTRVQELLAQGESTESSVPLDQAEPPQEPNPTVEPSQESPEDTPKKKKKKKKDKVKEEEREEDIGLPSRLQDGGTTPMLNGTPDEADGTKKKKKKKKEKEKHLKQEEEEIELPRMDVPGSDSSGYHSDKPTKKRKQEPRDDVELDLELPKSKKKKKSEIEQFA